MKILNSNLDAYYNRGSDVYKFRETPREVERCAIKWHEDFPLAATLKLNSTGSCIHYHA